MNDDLIEKYLDEYFGDMYPGIDLWWKRKVVEGQGKIFRVVHEKSKVIGLMVSDTIQNKLCHLSVHPEHRRQGVGRFLYKYALDIFRSDGTGVITAHGTHRVVYEITKYLDNRWYILRSLHRFGRKGPRDIEMIIDLRDLY